jgi:hypothetical protein
MSSVIKLWSRLAAVVTGTVLAVVVPAHAWAASNGLDTVMIEAARSRRRRGGFGFFGLFGGLCCLFVVAAIVLVIVLVQRNKRNKRP